MSKEKTTKVQNVDTQGIKIEIIPPGVRSEDPLSYKRNFNFQISQKKPKMREEEK